jgi:maltooligosyltrehalose trehalohydrolase
MATDEIEAMLQKDREPQTLRRRRLPIGAEVFLGSGVHFRVWSTRAQCMEVVIEDGAASGLAAPITVTLTPEGHGYFSGLVPTLGNGVLSHYRIDGGDMLYPDPASRIQPHGLHGPSQVPMPSAWA